MSVPQLTVPVMPTPLFARQEGRGRGWHHGSSRGTVLEGVVAAAAVAAAAAATAAGEIITAAAAAVDPYSKTDEWYALRCFLFIAGFSADIGLLVCICVKAAAAASHGTRSVAGSRGRAACGCYRAASGGSRRSGGGGCGGGIGGGSVGVLALLFCGFATVSISLLLCASSAASVSVRVLHDAAERGCMSVRAGRGARLDACQASCR